MSWLIAIAALGVAAATVAWARAQVRRAAAFPAVPPPESTPDAAMTRALAAVAEQADRLARGEALPATDSPPSGPGAVALEALDRAGARMQQMTAARAHIIATSRDLERARAMYRSILPLSSVAQHGRLRVAGSCTPAADTGGDWWTYRTLTGGRLLVVVGDATGHGVYSAMIGCAAHGAVEALSHVGEVQLTPGQVLRAINAAIRIPGADRAAMTCFAALFDPAGTISYANASHMLPLIGTTDATGQVTKVRALNTPGGAVENIDDSEVSVAEVTEGSHALAPGEVVVLFTDGLTDTRDRGGRAFGHRRLQQAMQQQQFTGGEAAITRVRDRLVGEVTTFADGVPPDDDVTLVVCALDRS